MIDMNKFIKRLETYTGVAISPSEISWAIEAEPALFQFLDDYIQINTPNTLSAPEHSSNPLSEDIKSVQETIKLLEYL
jgi:hypothetical protein